ncbi:MAG: DUF1178 family protein [Burkholderiales bacterium]|jgi:hypothetical protein|nr:DUF1178 family protein [Burkholderiales bacterium]MBP6250484.1 DUF1178 family protein [Leptothrix sp. (in: b-proteobacteria)]MBP7520867.1 DUF1178 family protein [Leptothrix sp. (in: b-proteobacteria)]HQY09173.1 DUF1178 family protein [Burkholderiaceae bacterium]
MKVFNLRCEQGHGFEGWFASEGDYQAQTQRGLLQCPVCNSARVDRLPSAPRLNLGERRSQAPSMPAPGSSSSTRAGGRPEQPGREVGSGEVTAANTSVVAALEAQYLQVVRQVLANTEDVGARFTEEVRRIHYGETEHRNIRGQADAQQREALREEGIEVVALPIPESLKGPLQ